MKINNIRGDLTNVWGKTKTLELTVCMLSERNNASNPGLNNYSRNFANVHVDAVVLQEDTCIRSVMDRLINVPSIARTTVE